MYPPTVRVLHIAAVSHFLSEYLNTFSVVFLVFYVRKLDTPGILWKYIFWNLRKNFARFFITENYRLGVLLSWSYYHVTWVYLYIE